MNARTRDAIMRRWPAYTLALLDDADAYALLQTLELVTNDHLGDAEDAESG